MAVVAASSPHIVLHGGPWHRTGRQQRRRQGIGRHTHASGYGDAGPGCSPSAGVWDAVGIESARRGRATAGIGAFWVSKPSSVEMEPIGDMETMDLVLRQAQDLSQPIVIEWMASWCRKCIYLKPKLEKLAAEFYSKLKFYYVDVNKVPQALVKRGNISKMPTIQLWEDGEMKEEVIGGHKAWLVVEEVREMILRHIR